MFLPATVLESPTQTLGCTVVRRISDHRGREWRVRELSSRAGQALLYQCVVTGIHSELRPAHVPLELLTDEDLVLALEDAEDWCTERQILSVRRKTCGVFRFDG